MNSFHIEDFQIPVSNTQFEMGIGFSLSGPPEVADMIENECVLSPWNDLLNQGKYLCSENNL